MTAPDTERDRRAQLAVTPCQCGHARRRHELPGFDGECVADGCRCTTYRPRLPSSDSVEVVLPVRRPFAGALGVPAPARSGVEQVIAAGKQSASKRTVAIAERIETWVADLYRRLRAEREARDAEAQLAAAKAVTAAPAPVVEPLPPEDEPAVARVAGGYVCPDCGQACANGTGLAAHKRKHAAATSPCPDCGRPIKAGGLGAHRLHAHGIRKDA